MQAVNLRAGNAVIHNGEIHIVLDHKHFTPGNKRAFVQASLKNMKSGKIVQNKFSSTEDVETAHLESKKMQYLYHDTHGFHFMDLADYHTITVNEETVGDAKHFFIENLELDIRFHGEQPITLELPKQIRLKVTESPPWVKGDSVSNNMKPATLETGYQIQVPIFIKEGEVIRVNTQTGEYAGRE
jgi:elongation factor P